MSVRYRPDRLKWEASFTQRGRRCRQLFDLKKDALEFEKKAKLKKFDLDEVEVKRIEIAAGFSDYFKSDSVDKSAMSKSNDRWYFNLANHFLTVDRELEFLDEISLQDLEYLQKWLLSEQKLKEVVLDKETQKPVFDSETGEWKTRDRIKPAWSSSSVNRAFHTLKHFFNRMCAWEKLEKSPAQFLSMLPEQAAEKESLTFEIYQKVMSHKETPEWFKDVMEFIYCLGPRPTSVERLIWPRVNFVERWLEIDSKKGSDATTKLIRLPMTDQVFALLVRVRNKWPEATGAVFRFNDGKPVSAGQISKVGNRIIHAQGFPGVVLYGARHGLAAELIDAGISLDVVQKLLGHASIKTTQGYTRGTKSATLLKALTLVRGPAVPPDATNEKLKTAVGSSDSE